MARPMTSEEFLQEFPEHAGLLKKQQRGDELKNPRSETAGFKASGGGVTSGGSKYRNQKTVVDGIEFDSKREAKRYRVLKAWEETGLITKLERQVPHRVVINGVEVFEYIADFVYRRPPPSEVGKTGAASGGERVVEDSKGMRTAVYRLKKKVVEAYFGIVIVEV